MPNNIFVSYVSTYTYALKVSRVKFDEWHMLLFIGILECNGTQSFMAASTFELYADGFADDSALSLDS
jgi:hypothetical protein